MADYFDELMQMWNKTTDEHVEWQRKRNTFSLDELFHYVEKLSRDADEFDEKTKHMKSDITSNHTSILAAKFKNQYEINRFLVSVLLESTIKLVEVLTKKIPKPSELEKSDKVVLSKEMKKVIAEQVKIEISKLKKQGKISLRS